MIKREKNQNTFFSWLFRKPNNQLAAQAEEKIKKRAAVAFGSIILAFFVCVVLVGGCLVAFPGVGISGTYLAYSSADEDDQRSVLLSLNISLDNTCELVAYYDGSVLLEEPVKRTYRWKIRYSPKKDEAESELIPWSSLQFSFENPFDQSLFQYYYFPQDGRLISKTLNSMCDDGICVFTKNYE